MEGWGSRPWVTIPPALAEQHLEECRLEEVSPGAAAEDHHGVVRLSRQAQPALAARGAAGGKLKVENSGQ